MNSRPIKLFIFCIFLFKTIVSQPSNLYLFSKVASSDGHQLTTISLANGSVTTIDITQIPPNIFIESFLTSRDDKFIMMLTSFDISPTISSFSILTLTTQGDILNFGENLDIVDSSYEFYDTSYQYDNITDTVYFGVRGPEYDQIIAYDFPGISPFYINVTETSFTSCPSGAYLRPNYYLLSPSEDFLNYTLVTVDVTNGYISPILKLKEFPQNISPYSFTAKGKLYAVAYDNYEDTYMSIISINPTTGDIAVTYNFGDIGLNLSLFYWTKDNYFTLLTLSQYGLYYLQTLDLETNEIVSKTEVKGKFSLDQTNITGGVI